MLWQQFQAGTRRFKLVGTEKKFYFVHVQDIAQAFWQVANELGTQETNAPSEFLHYALRGNAPPIDVKDLMYAMSSAWGETLEGEYGAFPFRANEVMYPPQSIPILPNWQAKISLKEGLKSL
jgi:nucleoside-diphosphate-sugar epimerase